MTNISTLNDVQKIIVLDYGSQYNQLIARRIREFGVFSELKSHKITADEVRAIDPIGIVLSGGPNSVYAEDAFGIDEEIFELGIPILGICYGMQLLTHKLGGKVVPASFCRRFEPKSIQLGLLASIHLNKIYSEGKTWEYQNQSTGIANFQTKYFLEAEQLLIPNHQVLEQFYLLVMPLITKAHNSEQIKLALVRDALLPKLISGELVLDDLPEDVAEVAEAL